MNVTWNLFSNDHIVIFRMGGHESVGFANYSFFVPHFTLDLDNHISDFKIWIIPPTRNMIRTGFVLILNPRSVKK